LLRRLGPVADRLVSSAGARGGAGTWRKV